MEKIKNENFGKDMLWVLPEELKEHGRFCTWRYEDVNGRKTKLPFHPITGEMARSNEKESFCTFDEATNACRYDGIGIGIFDGIGAIDLDHCILEDGTITQEAYEIVELMHSYTEYSPSGTGIHILFQTKAFSYDKEKYYIMNRGRNIEVYVAGATNKYVTVTGERMNDYEFGDRSRELTKLLELYMRRENVSSDTCKKETLSNAVNAINAKNSLSEDEILKIVERSGKDDKFQKLWRGEISGYPSHSEADLALCMKLAFWTGKDKSQMDQMFRHSGLFREKWDRKQSGSTYGEITIRKAIQECSNVYQPMKKRMEENGFRPYIPLKARNKELPDFPIDALPKTLAEYIKAVSVHTQTSIDMGAVIVLGTMAVCVQGKYQVEATPGYIEPLSLYTVIIAAPGERKSSVMGEITNVIYEYEKEYNKTCEPMLRQNRQEKESLERRINGMKKQLEKKYDESMEKELNRLEEELDLFQEEKPLRLFADDCSSEALTTLLSKNNGRFAVISTEGGIFDIIGGRYSSKANIDVWLKGHCGDAIRIDRMGRASEYIPSPHLSAILTIQPSVLEEIMDNTTMTGRGLIARFLFSMPVSKIGTRSFLSPSIPADIKEDYKRLVFTLLGLPQMEEAVSLTFSQEAVHLISDYFLQHEKFLSGEGQEISDWANKYIGTVIRIAGLLHLAEDQGVSTEIQVETVRNAIEIGKYFLAHAEYAYSLMGVDLMIKKAKFVWAKLLQKKVDLMKRSELFQICRGKFFKKTEDIFPTLDLLEAHGYLKQVRPEYTNVGRPPDVQILINPEAREK